MPPAPVKALERGIMLLKALADDGAATLSDLAVVTDLPPSTVHRLLATLAAHGFVAFDEGTQAWSVGVELFRVGASFAQRGSLVEVARPVLRALVDETGESANLGLVDAAGVVFLGQVESANPVRAFFPPGSRSHVHASGIGKALLAHLPGATVMRMLGHGVLPALTSRTLTTREAVRAELATTRARGYALDDEEAHPGMRCIAAAIFNEHGEAVAGLSISGPTARLDDAAVAAFGPAVRRAADEVTASLGGQRTGSRA